jgi:hypothetical protein
VPHRERVAWLSLVAIGATYVPYFVLTAADPPPAGSLPNLDQLARFAATAIAQMLILGVGLLVMRLRDRDSREPADERDRAIELRSHRIAYYVLIFGAILAGAILPFTESGWAVVNATLAAIVLSEVVHGVLTVHSYRRGLHA